MAINFYIPNEDGYDALSQGFMDDVPIGFSILFNCAALLTRFALRQRPSESPSLESGGLFIRKPESALWQKDHDRTKGYTTMQCNG